jgi:hypothetical protein
MRWLVICVTLTTLCLGCGTDQGSGNRVLEDRPGDSTRDGGGGGGGHPADAACGTEDAGSGGAPDGSTGGYPDAGPGGAPDASVFPDAGSGGFPDAGPGANADW